MVSFYLTREWLFDAMTYMGCLREDKGNSGYWKGLI